MILTKYSKRALEAHEYVNTINDSIKSSKWNKKFAWRKTPVTVPGIESESVISLAWIRTYYTREIYSITKKSSGIGTDIYTLKKEHTVNVPDMDSLSYYAIQGTRDEDDISTIEMDRFGNEKINPVKYALVTDTPFLICGYFDREYKREFRSRYRREHELIAGTELAEGMITPDELDEIKVRSR